MAMTIFILSDADDRKMIGTLENSRILWHQWNPLKNGSMMSRRIRCGEQAAVSSRIFLKSSTYFTSYPHRVRWDARVSAMVISSSIIRILYITLPSFCQITKRYDPDGP